MDFGRKSDKEYWYLLALYHFGEFGFLRKSVLPSYDVTIPMDFGGKNVPNKQLNGEQDHE